MENEQKRKAHEAADLHDNGYNCAQSVLITYHKECGISREVAVNITAPFAAGLARQREVCGAVAGMSMALGLLIGSSKDKNEIINITKELCTRFKERHGSIVCRDILVGRAANKSKKEASLDVGKEYYATKPCSRCIEDAAEFLEEYI